MNIKYIKTSSGYTFTVNKVEYELSVVKGEMVEKVLKLAKKFIVESDIGY